MAREPSKSQQRRFAVQKDRNKRAKLTKQHSVKTEYKRTKSPYRYIADLYEGIFDESND